MKSEVQKNRCHLSSMTATVSEKNPGDAEPNIRRLWPCIAQRINKSVGRYIIMIVVGIVICSIGNVMVTESTFLQWSGGRESEYFAIYGRETLTEGQWWLAIIGALINITGIAMTYIAMNSCVKKIKPASRQNSWLAKIVAFVLCVVAFVITVSWRSFVGDGKSHISIWDYLILCVVCRGIWRVIVGNKKPKE